MSHKFFGPLDILHEFYEPWAAGDSVISVHNHFTSDAVTQYLPYRLFAESAYRSEGRIAWNDMQYMGIPAWSNTMAGYDDWTTQLHRWFEFSVAWHLGLLGSFLIAAVGMYLFLRSVRIGPGLALACSIAFSANSQFVNWIFHRFQLASFAWVPWMLWAMNRTKRDDSSHAWVLVPIFLALGLLGGTLQTAVYVLITAVVAGIFLAYGEKEWSRRQCSPKWRSPAARNLILWLGLAFGLAACSGLGEVSYYLETVRSGQVRGNIDLSDSSGNFLTSGVFTLLQLAPNLLGSPRSIDLVKVIDGDLFNIAYAGTLTGVLAIAALFRRDAPTAARMMAVLGLGIPLTPLVGPLYHRVQIIWIFGAIWLFGWYWKFGMERGGAQFARWLFRVWCGFIVVWALASVLTVAFEHELSSFVVDRVQDRAAQGDGQFSQYSGWLEARAHRLVPELRIWAPRQLAWIAGCSLCLAAFLRRAEGRPLHVPLLLIGLLVELGAYAGSWITIVDPDDYPIFAERADLVQLRESASDGLVHVIRSPGSELLLPANLLAVHGIRSLEQYESLRPVGAWQRSGFAEDSRTLGSLGVTIGVTAQGYIPSDLDWIHVRSEDAFEVWRNPHAQRRYTAIYDSTLGLDDPEKSMAGDSIIVIHEAPSERIFEIPAGVAGIRVAENCLPGWKARITSAGQAETTCGEDGTLRAIFPTYDLPRQLELWYEPALGRLGRTISLTTLFFLGALWCLRSRISRRRFATRMRAG